VEEEKTPTGRPLFADLMEITELYQTEFQQLRLMVYCCVIASDTLVQAVLLKSVASTWGHKNLAAANCRYNSNIDRANAYAVDFSHCHLSMLSGYHGLNFVRSALASVGAYSGTF